MKRIEPTYRSQCPISLALEVVGDRWSLLIIRDLMFAGKRHFREFLASEEGISSNILAERLKTLVEAGILTKSSDDSHRQKAIYSLTSKGIDLLPVLAQVGIWGRTYLPVTKSSSAVAVQLERGGPKLWGELQVDLRRTHLS